MIVFIYLKRLSSVFEADSTSLEEYGLELSLYPLDLKEKRQIFASFKDFYYEGEMTPHTLVPPRDLHELVQATFYDKFEYFSIGTGTSPAEFIIVCILRLSVRQGKR